MDTWVKLVAVSNGLGAALTLGAGVLFAAFGAVGSEPGDELPGLIVGALVLALGALQAAIAVGVWRHRPWGRTGAIALALVLLFTGGGSLPAIATLIVLFHPKGRALFFSDTTPRIERSAHSMS